MCLLLPLVVGLPWENRENFKPPSHRQKPGALKMTDDRPTLARLAGEYGLKTLDADIAAKKVGLTIRRGAAIVQPWQEAKLRPELQRMKAQRDYRKWRATQDAELEAAETYGVNDTARFGFSNSEMARQLKPIRERMDDQSEDSA